MVKKKRTSFYNNSALLDERSAMKLVIPKDLVGENLKTPPVKKVGRSVGRREGDEVIGEWQKREKENSNSGWI